jgi:hypothetical protein
VASISEGPSRRHHNSNSKRRRRSKASSVSNNEDRTSNHSFCCNDNSVEDVTENASDIEDIPTDDVEVAVDPDGERTNSHALR